MAKNWTVGDAAKVIFEGVDVSAIMDIGKRFPLFAVACAKVDANGVKVLSAIPEYITVRKVEAILKGDVAESVDVESDESEEVAERPVKKDKKEKKEKKDKKDKKEKKE